MDLQQLVDGTWLQGTCVGLAWGGALGKAATTHFVPQRLAGL